MNNINGKLKKNIINSVLNTVKYCISSINNAINVKKIYKKNQVYFLIIIHIVMDVTNN